MDSNTQQQQQREEDEVSGYAGQQVYEQCEPHEHMWVRVYLPPRQQLRNSSSAFMPTMRPMAAQEVHHLLAALQHS